MEKQTLFCSDNWAVNGNHIAIIKLANKPRINYVVYRFLKADAILSDPILTTILLSERGIKIIQNHDGLGGNF